MTMIWDEYFAFEHGALVFLLFTAVMACGALYLARTFFKKI